VSSGRCVDNNGNLVAEGNRVQTFECSGSDAQKWAIGNDGALRNHTLCLRPAAAAVGALMQIRACDGGPYQVWQFRADQSLYNPGSGLCLTDPGTDPHNQLTLTLCTGDSPQRWNYS
jgi:hypothetical protein